MRQISIPTIGVETPDERLVERMRDGDTWAKEAFYRKHVDIAFRTALRLMRNHEDAEDVVQDAFTQAFRDIGQVREPKAARAWLLRIVVNRAHRRFRRRALQRALGFESRTPMALDELVSPTVSPEVRAELSRVDATLNEMVSHCRFAWILRYVNGHTVSEVAALMGVSEATVKRRLADANQVIERLQRRGEP